MMTTPSYTPAPSPFNDRDIADAVLADVTANFTTDFTAAAAEMRRNAATAPGAIIDPTEPTCIIHGAYAAQGVLATARGLRLHPCPTCAAALVKWSDGIRANLQATSATGFALSSQSSDRCQ
jgi:hypothetical protein